MTVAAKSISRISYDQIDLICQYLKITQINTFSSTCREFYSMFYVHSHCEQFSHLVSADSNSNLLYCSSVLQHSRKFQNSQIDLKLVRFSFSTKDQGWVNECESGSWIEAEFPPQKITDDAEQAKENNRMSLVYNYEVPEFVSKEKILLTSSIPQENNKINIYLRSSGGSWKIACKKAQIVYLYSNRLKLNEKQMVK